VSVRKRQWVTGKGEPREAWVVDYVDTAGKRRLKTFSRKKKADAFAATSKVEVADGTHVPDRDSATVGEAGELWIARAEAAGLERSTVTSYRQQLDLHIKPFVGGTRLSKFTVPSARAFKDKLREGGHSPSMIRRVMKTMGSIIADAQELGLIARNPMAVAPIPWGSD
jgi:integrase